MLRKIIPILVIACVAASPLFAQIEVDPKPAVEAAGAGGFSGGKLVG